MLCINILCACLAPLSRLSIVPATWMLFLLLFSWAAASSCDRVLSLPTSQPALFTLMHSVPALSVYTVLLVAMIHTGDMVVVVVQLLLVIGGIALLVLLLWKQVYQREGTGVTVDGLSHSDVIHPVGTTAIAAPQCLPPSTTVVSNGTAALPSPAIAAVSCSPCLPSSSTTAASNATGITARTPTSGTALESSTAHSIVASPPSCSGSSSAVINGTTSGSAVVLTAHDVAVPLPARVRRLPRSPDVPFQRNDLTSSCSTSRV
ncbi:hypothetical protein D9758_012608 [Tetrapyrgos nigripes]|uniref:Uncharacterized protein n=1 Tax=Tetrapyrgos nigripes TaxID=182062 RepID=A0A8H5LMI9_9AGAR|nr:hypothetical protein D9758_012608 [Tetrapyrgos nigripes]